MNLRKIRERFFHKFIYPRRLDKWADALQSGKYEQGTAVMKDWVGKYCVLGVAAEVFRLTTGKGTWCPSGALVVDKKHSGKYRRTSLAVEVADWYGISTFPQYSNDFSLATMSDQKKLDFWELGKWVRENKERLLIKET